jgi:uncharacterized membrane protein
MGWRQPSAGPGSRTARLAGAGVISLIASVGALYLVLPLVIRGIVRALTLTVRGCVWLAASMSSGADPWTIVAAVGQAAGDTMATREASLVLLLLAAVGGLAFYGLQRLIGSDEESSR